MVNVDIRPHFYSDYVINVDTFIIPTISSYSPNTDIDSKDYKQLKNLQLADPIFVKKRSYRFISTTCRASLIIGDIRRGKECETIATSSNLGWIIFRNSGKG